MTPEQINQQIQSEYMEWNKSPYSGNPALPKDFLETFKKAVFYFTPSIEQNQNIFRRPPVDVISKIISKKIKELTNIDVPIILNTISSVSFDLLYDDLNEALVRHKEIDEIKVAFNITVAHINEQTEIKRNNLLSLNGMGNGKIKAISQA